MLRSRVRRLALDAGLVALLLLALAPGLLPDRTHPGYWTGTGLMALLAAATRVPAVDRWLDRWIWIASTLMIALIVAATGGVESHFRIGFLVITAYAALVVEGRAYLAACGYVLVCLFLPLAYDQDASGGLGQLLVDGLAYATVTVAIRLLATHSERLRRDIGHQQQHLLSLYDDTPLPMLAVDVDGVVTRTNRATDLLVGRRQRLTGRRFVRLVPAGPQRTALEDALAHALGGALATVDLQATVDDDVRDLEVTVVPRRGDGGAVVELLAFGRDVTRERQAHDAIVRRDQQREGLARLGMEALAGADLSTLLHRATAIIVASLPADDSSVMVPVAGGNAMTIRAYEGNDPDQWRDRTLPTEGSLGGFVFTTGNGISSDDFRAETRFPIPSWLLDSPTRSGVAVPIHTPEGPWGVLAAACAEPRKWSDDDRTFVLNIANVLGSAVQRDRAARRLREEEARFRQIADNAQDVVFRVDLAPRPHLTYVSPSVEDLLGRSVEDLLADPDLWFSTVDQERLEAEHPDGTAPLERTANERIPLRHVNGDVVWLEVRRSPVRDESGHVVGFDGIARDVTAAHRARRVLEEALAQEQRAAAELRRVDAMRDNFLAAVSHELRTPLAGVLGFAMTLEDSRDRMDEGQVGLLLHRLSANAQRLDSLLADLLDLDRLRRSTLEPGLRNTDLGALVRRVARLRDAEANRLVVEAPSLVAAVDPPMVERIVENLLANALRHAGPTATIWLRVEAEDDDVVLVVEDDGPGIPAEIRETIFLPFEQGDHGHAHAPGTGIGLSLVAQFAALHGGRAWVAERRGGGASFRVRLPDARVEGPAEPSVDQLVTSRSPQRGQNRAPSS